MASKPSHGSNVLDLQMPSLDRYDDALFGSNPELAELGDADLDDRESTILEAFFADPEEADLDFLAAYRGLDWEAYHGHGHERVIRPL